MQGSVFKPFGLVSHIIMKLKRAANPASQKSFAGHLWAGGKWSGRWWKRTKEPTIKEQLLVCRCCSKWLKLKGPNCLWELPQESPEWRQLYKIISAFRMSAWEINVQIPLTNHTVYSASSSLASHCLYQASLGETPPVPGVLHPERGGNVTVGLSRQSADESHQP